MRTLSIAIVQIPFLGIEISDGPKLRWDQEIPVRRKEQLRQLQCNGVKVVSVRGPALRAGLEPNDIIEKINGVVCLVPLMPVECLAPDP